MFEPDDFASGGIARMLESNDPKEYKQMMKHI